MTQPTYYDILGISLSADTEIIDAAYQALTKKYKHNPNAAHRLVQIRQAYETLSDPIKRADYDSWLQMNARFSRTTPPNFGTQTTHSPIQTTDDYRPHEPPKYPDLMSVPKLCVFMQPMLPISQRYFMTPAIPISRPIVITAII